MTTLIYRRDLARPLTVLELDENFTNINTELLNKAPITSPVLTGIPKAPTAPYGTSTTQLATTAFVQAGFLTNISTVLPLSQSSDNIPAISISKASISSDGYLSSDDWDLFNRKQNNLGYIPSADDGTYAYGVWNISILGNSATATNVAYSGLTGTIPTWNQNTTGNAATATELKGTIPIWNQNTTGNAATATNVAYSGLTGTIPTWNQNTTGNAATATNVAYSGLTGTIPTWNQNTTGNAATATHIAYSGLTGTIPTWNQNTTGNAATATNAVLAATATHIAYSGLTGTIPTWNQNTTGNATTATTTNSLNTNNNYSGNSFSAKSFNMGGNDDVFINLVKEGSGDGSYPEIMMGRFNKPCSSNMEFWTSGKSSWDSLLSAHSGNGTNGSGTITIIGNLDIQGTITSSSSFSDSFGNNQTYHDVTSSRTFGTYYTNATKTTIWISAVVKTNDLDSDELYLWSIGTVNGIEVTLESCHPFGSGWMTHQFFVPPNGVYKIDIYSPDEPVNQTSYGQSIIKWVELK